LLACALTRLFRSRARLEAEILVLRHQLNVLRRKAPKRVAFSSIDRLVFAGLYRLALEIESARWPTEDTTGDSSAHSRHEYCEPLWGAPRIHGELLMLGIYVGQTTVAKYMVR
jgi:hypothetical protein